MEVAPLSVNSDATLLSTQSSVCVERILVPTQDDSRIYKGALFTVKLMARIEVGRFGYRSAKPISSAPNSNAVIVDCRRLSDPAIKRSNGKIEMRAMKLYEIEYELFRDQMDAVEELVQSVVDAVLKGRVVCVKCLMGKHRSQAIASIAQKHLSTLETPKDYDGKVHILGKIKKTK